jgi:hypothetical protein
MRSRTILLVVVLASASGLIPKHWNHVRISTFLQNPRTLPVFRIAADTDDVVLSSDVEGYSHTQCHDVEHFHLDFQNESRGIMYLRGGVGLGGREVKVKAVKKKHVASNPKPKEGDNTKADGLSRSQRRKVKEEVKVGRSSGKSGNAPAMSALDEAVEIAARAAKSSRANPSLRTAFGQLDLLDDESGAFSIRKGHTAVVSSSSEVPDYCCFICHHVSNARHSLTVAQATNPMPNHQKRNPTPHRLARHPCNPRGRGGRWRGRARRRRRATSGWRRC